MVRISIQGQPGSFVEFHLNHNTQLLGRPGFYLKTLTVLIPAAVVVAHRWKEKPLFLRRSLVVCLVPLFVLAFFLGFADELRVCYEVYPIVILLMILTVMEALGIHSRTRVEVPCRSDLRYHDGLP